MHNDESLARVYLAASCYLVHCLRYAPLSRSHGNSPVPNHQKQLHSRRNYTDFIYHGVFCHRILGKIGGIPALGPGMANVLPQLPRGQILKATASPAAREIYYSKVEQKDAA